LCGAASTTPHPVEVIAIFHVIAIPINGVGEASMQAATCVFLMHELPAAARANVLLEAFRVLEPGGVFVLADSVQLADSPQYKVAMENFRRVFHEPYYRDYISDDIGARLRQSGFVDITAETHFMSRVWGARKPL
jgi:ubiquinone/menaquinone biosynthesis C-methylase UbiE